MRGEDDDVCECGHIRDEHRDGGRECVAMDCECCCFDEAPED